jgi:hypothetical protein
MNPIANANRGRVTGGFHKKTFYVHVFFLFLSILIAVPTCHAASHQPGGKNVLVLYGAWRVKTLTTGANLARPAQVHQRQQFD